MADPRTPTTLALNCTLTRSPGRSSTELIARQVLTVPEETASTKAAAAHNAVHLARLRGGDPYPAG